MSNSRQTWKTSFDSLPIELTRTIPGGQSRMGRDCYPGIFIVSGDGRNLSPILSKKKRASVIDILRRRRSLLRIPFIHRSLMDVERHVREVGGLFNLCLAGNSNPDLPAIVLALSMTTPERRRTIRVENRKCASGCAARNLFSMQSKRSGAYVHGKKEPW